MHIYEYTPILTKDIKLNKCCEQQTAATIIRISTTHDGLVIL